MTHRHFILSLLLGFSACSLPKTGVESAPNKAPISDFRNAPCAVGIYGDGSGAFVAVTRSTDGYRYSFDDGRVGKVGSDAASVTCGKDSIMIGQDHIWNAIAIKVTDTRFTSGDVMLAGRMLEPVDADETTPLIIYAHGSENAGWIGSSRDPYQMVGRGISVFVYDKRGTGLSEGKYSQNFPRLADDLAAAAAEAKRIAGGRFGRVGLVGLSQGGWVAPLAAEKAQADFIVIGYGIVADIREEDADQVQKELRDAGYDASVLGLARAITDVTARIAASQYTDGLDELAEIQRRYSSKEWFPLIRGSYTGVFLNSSVDDLREHGVPQFNDLDIDWTLKPMSVLRGVKVPQLWVLADEDREAPIDLTLQRLQTLRNEGSEIDITIFPNTDHGMWEYDQASDGTRDYLRITAGYYDLIADYIKGRSRGVYGRSASAEGN